MVSSSTHRTQPFTRASLDRGAYLSAKRKNTHNWFGESGRRGDMVSVENKVAELVQGNIAAF